MKKQSRTIFTVLGMLTIAPMSGYEITKTIRNSTSFFWSESEGQIYPALRECLKLGLATCQEDSAKETNRNKKIYKISNKGKKELISWLSEKAQPALVRNELLLKLFFGGNVDARENIHRVIDYKKEVLTLLKIYKNLRIELINDKEYPSHLKFWLITLDYGEKIAKAELKWCEETLITLEM
jgi:DNA-binding PadR family transcriptional regulator